MLEKKLKKISIIEIVKQTHNHAHALFNNNDLFQITLSDDNDIINVSDVESENETSKKQKQKKKTDAEQCIEIFDAV